MTTAEKIAVMQAYLDGKPIQFSNNNNEWTDWTISLAPTWNWSEYDFRIKPEDKPVRMTNRQLAKWCADNNGQLRNRHSYIRTYHSYCQGEDDVSVREEIRIRHWGSDDWIEPTVDIYEKDCKGN